MLEHLVDFANLLVRLPGKEPDDLRVILWLEGETDLTILRAIAKGADKDKAFANEHLEVAYNLKDGDEDKVAGHQKLLSRMLGQEVRIIAVFDADYRRLTEKAPHIIRRSGPDEAVSFVLGKKEIENYLLDPVAVSSTYRVMIAKTGPGKVLPSDSEIREAIRDWAKTSVHENLRRKFVTQHTGNHKGYSADRKLEEAEARCDRLFGDDAWLLSSVPGKEAIRFLSQSFQKTTGVELLPENICGHITPPPDLLLILEELEEALAAATQG